MTPNACPCAGRQAGNLYVVMEHCRYGELDTFIRYRAAAARPFSEDEVMFMCAMGSKGVRMKGWRAASAFISRGLSGASGSGRVDGLPRAAAEAVWPRPHPFAERMCTWAPSLLLSAQVRPDCPRTLARPQQADLAQGPEGVRAPMQGAWHPTPPAAPCRHAISAQTATASWPSLGVDGRCDASPAPRAQRAQGAQLPQRTLNPR